MAAVESCQHFNLAPLDSIQVVGSDDFQSTIDKYQVQVSNNQGELWCVLPTKDVVCFSKYIDIKNLPKYIFEVSNGDVGQPDVRACKMMPMGTNSPNFSTGCVLPTKDVVCFSFSSHRYACYLSSC
ncbi:hypothetical protein L1987_33391 [Smallanthus sonchifolius]|uniref:Uncharacterized protein n=1 Tax=Smallanthus sonchifolius TaxID=185202 RepID=A0ACB9HR98_9ASTR|nr:hypothetical protein L1987_33391 [Smallanthus sonchifolius]